MADALSTYRGQNGISQAGSYDPEVVDWIKRAAREAGADPAALLATSLMESGAQRGRVGDNGTSFGPFQFHRGGALANHSPAWANSYAAVLNRAYEFARLGVHHGQGAAAVQRPASPGVYAAGVNDLLARANAILGEARTPSPLAQAVTPAAPRLAWNPAATLDFVNAFLGDASINQLAKLGQRIGAQATSGTPGSMPGPSPSAPGGPQITLVPGTSWGGSEALARSLAQIGISNGLRIASEKRDRKNTSSGGISDHWIGSKTSYAYDLSNGSAPTPQMDRTATQIAAALGVPDWTGGVLNVNKGGYRYQVLYKTYIGGNHYNHVHVGVRKL